MAIFTVKVDDKTVIDVEAEKIVSDIDQDRLELLSRDDIGGGYNVVAVFNTFCWVVKRPVDAVFDGSKYD